MTLNVGMILARGGSVGIKGKNIKPLMGVPLINYTINAALDSNLNAVYLTTEDSEIMSVAKKCALAHKHFYKFKIYERPEELAQSHVQSHEVMTYLLRQLQLDGIEPTTLVMLQPTSPFRTATHINEALDLYYQGIEEEGLRSVISGYVDSKFHYYMDDGYLSPINHDPQRRMGRQWIQKEDKLFVENGSIYVCDSVKLSMERCYLNPPYLYYLMDERDSIDLDEPSDWLAAELEMQRRLNHDH